MENFYQIIDSHNVKINNTYQLKNINKGNIKVIILDDIKLMRHIMFKMLVILGIDENNITEVSSGMECLELIKKQHYDLIMIDINMPFMDGYETSFKLREDDFKGLLIAITGMIGYDEYLKAYKNGINYFHTKPYDMSTLKALLKLHNII